MFSILVQNGLGARELKVSHGCGNQASGEAVVAPGDRLAVGQPNDCTNIFLDQGDSFGGCWVKIYNPVPFEFNPQKKIAISGVSSGKDNTGTYITFYLPPKCPKWILVVKNPSLSGAHTPGEPTNITLGDD